LWAVVGLGNPEAKYLKTRHNLGFMVVDELAARHGGQFGGRHRHFVSASVEVGGQRAILVKPITYMNRSGLALREFLYGRPDFPPERLIVVQDDIDMETGRLKIRKGGSSGGHRGIESIIAETGLRDFIRVKIGIGRDPEMPPEKYVLTKFSKAERPLIEEAVFLAADAVEALITEGLAAAMNRFNRKPGIS
jgi:PTH1 family peptidyl-tRNA hydrolase